MPFAAMPVGWKLHSESYDPDVSQCRQVDLEGAVASTTLDHTPGNEASYFSLYSSVQAFAGGGHSPDSSFRVRTGPPPGMQAAMPKQ